MLSAWLIIAVAVVPDVVEPANAETRAVSFVNDVGPTLTRLGCNSGTCHGKAGGQNGFALSLLGTDPAFDFLSLTRDARGRRVFPAAPERSLILLKPTTVVPHGGGRRLDPATPEYHTIRRWIAQGMPAHVEHEARLAGLSVEPASDRLTAGATRTLSVLARYDDGSDRDVTRLALFQSNTPDLAMVDGRGVVETKRGPGEALILRGLPARSPSPGF